MKELNKCYANVNYHSLCGYPRLKYKKSPLANLCQERFFATLSTYDALKIGLSTNWGMIYLPNRR